MLVAIVRLVFMISGGIGGYRLMLEFRRFWGEDEVAWISALILSVILLVGVGYVVGGIIGRQIERLLERIEHSLQRYTGTDLIVAVFGLLVGLVVAALVSLPIREIEFFGTYLSALLFIIFGYLGLRLSLRKREDLRGISLLAAVPGRAPVGPRPKVLDTSVVIDGRIADIAGTGFLEGAVLVPRFVLRELQDLADSEDPLKRNRARRGLDVLSGLQREQKIGVEIADQDYPEVAGVDAKLIRLAKELDTLIVTNDYNLNKVAELEGVRVLNINELANAVKPVVLPGERMAVQVIREGKEANQGVAYLDDGTMVVIEGGKRFIGLQVDISVTSILQTPAGRMIFAKAEEPQGATA